MRSLTRATIRLAGSARTPGRRAGPRPASRPAMARVGLDHDCPNAPSSAPIGRPASADDSPTSHRKGKFQSRTSTGKRSRASASISPISRSACSRSSRAATSRGGGRQRQDLLGPVLADVEQVVAVVRLEHAAHLAGLEREQGVAKRRRQVLARARRRCTRRRPRPAARSSRAPPRRSRRRRGSRPRLRRPSRGRATGAGRGPAARAGAAPRGGPRCRAAPPRLPTGSARELLRAGARARSRDRRSRRRSPPRAPCARADARRGTVERAGAALPPGGPSSRRRPRCER